VGALGFVVHVLVEFALRCGRLVAPVASARPVPL